MILSGHVGFDQRKELIAAVEAARGGRRLICFLNFDRVSEPQLAGLTVMFGQDAKESTYRVLKETLTRGEKFDLFLYTRGGEVDAVWPIVNLLREFDADFEVLVPFRCHSSGTLLALGARRIVLTELSELSPVDPSVANSFNPTDSKGKPLGIAVEDVQQYRSYVAAQLELPKKLSGRSLSVMSDFLQRLVDRTHPLAIGNAYRVSQQIKQLATELLALHTKGDTEKIVEKFTTRFYSHMHAIPRREAKAILGDKIEFADESLTSSLDRLLRSYETTFELRKPFVLTAHMNDEAQKMLRFIGGAIESTKWSYLFETTARVSQRSSLPPNVSLQVPQGAALPIIPGFPREFQIELLSQAWIRNKEPRGVTV
jgi:hypothetical protein